MAHAAALVRDKMHEGEVCDAPGGKAVERIEEIPSIIINSLEAGLHKASHWKAKKKNNKKNNENYTKTG